MRVFILRQALVAIVIAIGFVASAYQAPNAVGAPPWSIARVPGRQLAYLDSGGSGVPIVFLHAGSGSSGFWESQIGPVRAAGYRFIAFDRVGSGRSTLDVGADPGSAADDLQSLATFLTLERFHLVGTAAGGIVSLDYAISFPDRLRSLVLANTVGGVQDPEYLALGRRLRPSPQFDALPTEFKELGPSYRATNPEGTARWVALEHASHPATPLASPQRNRNRMTFSLLETIRLPTLLLTGDADLYTPPAVLRMFAAKIPGAESRVIQEAGHSVYWEQAEEFNRVLLAFVARH
jgi:pimeloyl-ACP methyl ester carboxylesterase